MKSRGGGSRIENMAKIFLQSRRIGEKKTREDAGIS